MANDAHAGCVPKLRTLCTLCVIFFATFLRPVALAQDVVKNKQQACPLVFSKVRMSYEYLGGSYSDGADRHSEAVKIEWTNTTGKTIVGKIVKLSAINAVGQEEAFVRIPTLESRKVVKVDQKVKEGWLVPSLRDVRAIRVWLSAIRFSDGSLWEDNGSHGCGKNYP